MGKFTMNERSSKFELEDGYDDYHSNKKKTNCCCGACYISRPHYWMIIVALFLVLGIPLILLIVAMIITATVQSPYVQMDLDGVIKTSMNMTQMDKDRMADSLRHGLSFATVSSYVLEENEYENIAAFNAYLEKTFPIFHNDSKVEFTQVNNYSRFYRVEGSEPTQNPYLLMAHLDVVPPGDGEWLCDPFIGMNYSDCSHFGEETIYGRGAIDDKHSVMGILEALEYKFKNNEYPKRTFYLCFGHDEEVSGHNGAGHLSQKLNETLRQHGETLDFILDEGMFVMIDVVPGLSDPVAYFGVVEKGWAMFDVTATGDQVHSSTPPKSSAIGKLGKAVSDLEKNPQPNRFGEGAELWTLKYIAPFADNFIVKMAMSNLWLFEPLVKAAFASDSMVDAVQRTTTAVTMIDGGFKENVVPGSAHAVINHRMHQADDVNSVLKHDRDVVDNPDVQIIPRDDSFPPTQESPFDNDEMAWQILTNSVTEVFPTSVPTPGTMVANTDTVHYLELTNKIYRFSPVLLDMEGLGLFHGIDERIPKEHYMNVIQFYYRLISNADADIKPKNSLHAIPSIVELSEEPPKEVTNPQPVDVYAELPVFPAVPDLVTRPPNEVKSTEAPEEMEGALNRPTDEMYDQMDASQEIEEAVLEIPANIPSEEVYDQDDVLEDTEEVLAEDIADEISDYEATEVDLIEASVEQNETAVETVKAPIEEADLPTQMTEASVNSVEDTAVAVLVEVPGEMEEVPIEAPAQESIEVPIVEASPPEQIESPVVVEVAPAEAEESSIGAEEGDLNMVVPPAKAEATPVEVEETFVKAGEALVEPAGTPIEAKADSVEAKADSVVAKADSVEAKADSVETKADSVETKADSVETKADSVEAEAPPAKAEAFPVEVESTPVEQTEAPDAAVVPLDALNGPAEIAEKEDVKTEEMPTEEETIATDSPELVIAQSEKPLEAEEQDALNVYSSQNEDDLSQIAPEESPERTEDEVPLTSVEKQIEQPEVEDSKSLDDKNVPVSSEEDSPVGEINADAGENDT